MKLLLVEWEDSRGGPEGWERLSDLSSMEMCRAKSVGWLAVDEQDHIVLHSSMIGDDDPQVTGIICIPKRSIVNAVEIEEVDYKDAKGNHVDIDAPPLEDL